VAIVATGFAAGERPDHWKRHGYEFPELVDEFEYEQLAMAFLNERLDPTKVHECVRRRDGDTIRHEPGTENFAVMRGRGDTNLLPTAGWMAQIEQQFSFTSNASAPNEVLLPCLRIRPVRCARDESQDLPLLRNSLRIRRRRSYLGGFARGLVVARNALV
jgi:hypothetical protein